VVDEITAPLYEAAGAKTPGADHADLENQATDRRVDPRRYHRQDTRRRIMDLACGTADWVPHCAATCSRVTLFDQSERMLAEARAKADRLGILDRCVLVAGDFSSTTSTTMPMTRSSSAFLSHLIERQEALVFDAARRMLTTEGKCLVLEWAWSAERAEVNAKVERQTRRLNDGTSFEVYPTRLNRVRIGVFPHS